MSAQQLDLFTVSNTVTDIEERKIEALHDHNERHYDELSIIQDEIEQMMMDGDVDSQRFRELVQISQGYSN
jgi:hypothetical protein